MDKEKKKVRRWVDRGGKVFASGADISIRVGMNPADRFKARGSDESWTGAIPMKDARRTRMPVRVSAHCPRALHFVLAGKANETLDCSVTLTPGIVNKSRSFFVPFG